MADRPILFSAPMVRALIEGRKTQTRRVLAEKYRGILRPAHHISNGINGPLAHEFDRTWPIRTGYAIGDRLWVREAWGINHYEYHQGPIPKARPSDLTTQYMSYRATEDDCEIAAELCYRPSIHMPRWASRITLTVTDVRVERLQDISEADAIAEGIEPLGDQTGPNKWSVAATGPIGGWLNAPTAAETYALLWNDINGPESWDANPWVAAISFDVRQGNIDAIDAEGGKA